MCIARSIIWLAVVDTSNERAPAARVASTTSFPMERVLSVLAPSVDPWIRPIGEGSLPRSLLKADRIFRSGRVSRS